MTPSEAYEWLRTLWACYWDESDPYWRQLTLEAIRLETRLHFPRSNVSPEDLAARASFERRDLARRTYRIEMQAPSDLDDERDRVVRLMRAAMGPPSSPLGPRPPSSGWRRGG